MSTCTSMFDVKIHDSFSLTNSPCLALRNFIDSFRCEDPNIEIPSLGAAAARHICGLGTLTQNEQGCSSPLSIHPSIQVCGFHKGGKLSHSSNFPRGIWGETCLWGSVFCIKHQDVDHSQKLVDHPSHLVDKNHPHPAFPLFIPRSDGSDVSTQAWSCASTFEPADSWDPVGHPWERELIEIPQREMVISCHHFFGNRGRERDRQKTRFDLKKIDYPLVY